MIVESSIVSSIRSTSHVARRASGTSHVARGNQHVAPGT